MKTLLAQLTIPGYNTIDAPSSVPMLGKNNLTTSSIIGWALNAFIVVGILAAVIFLLYGGIKWITSAGDKTKVESARKTIIFTFVGLVLMVLSLVIVKFISDLFGVKYFGT